jgi:asparagine synthase (glutamine-hydrolysing)
LLNRGAMPARDERAVTTVGMGMSAFAGIVTFGGAPLDQAAEDAVCGAVTALRNGYAVVRRLEGALIAQRSSSRPGLDAQPLIGCGRSTLFTALARLDNRNELGAALGVGPTELAQTTDAALILRMIEHCGDAGVARCLGAFAFALWDTDSRRLILGRDCLGNRPLFFHARPGGVAFATTIKALLALPGVPRAIDEIALANFMVLNLDEERRTFYRDVERVPGRTLVTIDRTGVRHRRYWSPDLAAPPPCRCEDDYVERTRELLDQAVAAALRDTPRVAVATSGGLDSSAIAATAARLGLAESITCFSLVPPPGTAVDVGPLRYLSERDKVEALARMHPALKLRFIAPERPHPFEEDDGRYFARTSLPVLGPAVLGGFNHLYDAVVAEKHRALLLGTQGNFGLTWSGSFSLLALIDAGQWGTFAHELSAAARHSGRGLLRTFASDVVMPAAPLWLRRLIHRLRGRDPDNVNHYSALNPAFIAEFDLARQWRAQGFDPWLGPRGCNAARHRADYLFNRSQLARDIRGMSEEIHGFEARDPHGDRRLLEFVLAVPEPMFRKDGVPRSFARRVLADRLPPEILNERRRGVQVPTWFRSLDGKRQEIARDIERLEASPLASRLIDVGLLKRLMAQWPRDEHAAEQRMTEYRLALARGIHIGRFVCWVEGQQCVGNLGNRSERRQSTHVAASTISTWSASRNKLGTL